MVTGHMPNDYNRWAQKVDFAGPDDCWLWNGSRLPTGYGRFYYARNRSGGYAHRFSIEHHTGNRIPEGLYTDHLCRNPPCVNPRHLELVTPRENCLRAPKHIVHGDFADKTRNAQRPTTYCSYDECDRRVIGRGLCDMHWKRWKRHGDPGVVLKPWDSRKSNRHE